MTDFTPEQIKAIEAAVRAALVCPNKEMSLFEYIMAELQKPTWEPEEGEVYAHWPIGGVVSYDTFKRFLPKHNCRPLTPDEVPALRIAIEALERLKGPQQSIETSRNIASGMLDAINRRIGVEK